MQIKQICLSQAHTHGKEVQAPEGPQLFFFFFVLTSTLPRSVLCSCIFIGANTHHHKSSQFFSLRCLLYIEPGGVLWPEGVSLFVVWESSVSSLTPLIFLQKYGCCKACPKPQLQASWEQYSWWHISLNWNRIGFCCFENISAGFFLD